LNFVSYFIDYLLFNSAATTCDDGDAHRWCRRDCLQAAKDCAYDGEQKRTEFLRARHELKTSPRIVDLNNEAAIQIRI
jgi:hypothetical protein